MRKRKHNRCPDNRSTTALPGGFLFVFHPNPYITPGPETKNAKKTNNIGKNPFHNSEIVVYFSIRNRQTGLFPSPGGAGLPD